MTCIVEKVGTLYSASEKYAPQLENIACNASSFLVGGVDAINRASARGAIYRAPTAPKALLFYTPQRVRAQFIAPGTGYTSHE